MVSGQRVFEFDGFFRFTSGADWNWFHVSQIILRLEQNTEPVEGLSSLQPRLAALILAHAGCGLALSCTAFFRHFTLGAFLLRGDI